MMVKMMVHQKKKEENLPRDSIRNHKKSKENKEKIESKEEITVWAEEISEKKDKIDFIFIQIIQIIFINAFLNFYNII